MKEKLRDYGGLLHISDDPYQRFSTLSTIGKAWTGRQSMATGSFKCDDFAGCSNDDEGLGLGALHVSII
jgi:hypothetical protein